MCRAREMNQRHSVGAHVRTPTSDALSDVVCQPSACRWFKIKAMPPHTPDLFDEPTAATQAPVFQAAFDQWLAHQQTAVARRLTQASSVKAYTSLWQAFAAWCLAQTPVVALDTLTEADLAQYIHSRTAAPHVRGGAPRPSRLKQPGQFTPRHAWRLLMLIDGVLALRARAQRHMAPNRAARVLLGSRDDWRYANASRRDSLPGYLPPDQARLLVTHLTAGLPRSGRRGTDMAWQALRNRTAVALHLGAGLTPADVRALPWPPKALAPPGQALALTVRVPAHGDSAEREAPLASWAARVLACWLQVRQDQAIAGPWLLPSTRSGKPWGKVSHHQAVHEVLDASGIDPALLDGGAYRLRHTFALRQLRRGKPEDLVARWLGLVDPRAMGRYRRVDYANERPD